MAKNWMTRLGTARHTAATAIICAAVAQSARQPAVGGPPFATDDPVPVDYRHGELYAFAQGTQARGSSEGLAPGIEANYGIFPNAMLHTILPTVAYVREDGQTRRGYGDTELGLKYRFLDSGPGEARPILGVFPLLEVPTGNERRGLGGGQVQTFLPVWLQQDFGPWTTYGGGGYWINPGADNKDHWFFGWLLQRKVSDRVTLGGELFHETKDTVDGEDTSGFNFGGYYDFTDKHHLLFSAGRGLQNAAESNRFSYYMGYQLTF